MNTKTIIIISIITILGLILLSFLANRSSTEGFVSTINVSEFENRIAPHLPGFNKSAFESGVNSNLPSDTYTGITNNTVGVTVSYSSNKDGSYKITKKNANGSSTTYSGSSDTRSNDPSVIFKLISEFQKGTRVSEAYVNNSGVIYIGKTSDGVNYVAMSNPSINTNIPGAEKGTYLGILTQTSSVNATPTPTVTTPSITTPGLSNNLQNRNFSRHFDNYNHFRKSSVPTMYYGPRGTNAKLFNTSRGFYIIITDEQGNVMTYHPKHHMNATKVYHSEDGGTAKVIQNEEGSRLIEVIDREGNISVYSSRTEQTYDPTFDNHPSDDLWQKLRSYDINKIKHPDANVKVYGNNGDSPRPSPSPTAVTNAKDIHNDVNEPHHRHYHHHSNSLNANKQYNKYLPSGIPKHMIPHGDEDLYILKTQVVPPICPSCPAPIMARHSHKVKKSNNETQQNGSLPPPISERNPNVTSSPTGTAAPTTTPTATPSMYKYKKVPDYSQASNNPLLPSPPLNNYSTFGM
jgi:hypothetical protein